MVIVERNLISVDSELSQRREEPFGIADARDRMNVTLPRSRSPARVHPSQIHERAGHSFHYPFTLVASRRAAIRDDEVDFAESRDRLAQRSRR